MAAGVGVALNSFWILVNNWKTGSNSELTLKSENGRLSVKLSADLGVWTPPDLPPKTVNSNDASRGHQGPRKGAGPSRQRRRDRRAAERAAESALGDLPKRSEEAESEKAENACEAESTEEVETAVEAETVQNAETAKEAETAMNVVPKRKGRHCSKCGGPSKGHSGPCGPKCSVVPITPEKELSTSHPLDISLDLTPGQRIRVEQCANCGEEMQPDHQCSISPENIPVEVEVEK